MPFMISQLYSSLTYETGGVTEPYFVYASKAITYRNGIIVQFMLDDLSIPIYLHFGADRGFIS